MTLDQARALLGAGVVYRPFPGGLPEDGVITSVTDRWVFVRYRGDVGAKATDPAQLTPLAT